MTREEILREAKPILFNTEMTKVILDDRKTVTRRLIKPQPQYDDYDGLSWKGVAYGQSIPPSARGAAHNFKCASSYRTGDYLYVRETWCLGKVACGVGNYGSDVFYVSQCVGEDEYIPKEYCLRHDIGIEDVVWRPSIHMPKKAARLFLRVTSVRVEQLQDITDEEAEKEGITSFSKDGKLSKFAPSLEWWEKYHLKHKMEFRGTWWQDMPQEPKVAFEKLWDSTIKPANLPLYGWEANPWVWVIEFERVALE